MFMKAGLDMRPARLAPPSRPRREERERKKEMREGLEKDLNEDNLNNPLVSFDLVSGSMLHFLAISIHGHLYLQFRWFAVVIYNTRYYRNTRTSLQS